MQLGYCIVLLLISVVIPQAVCFSCLSNNKPHSLLQSIINAPHHKPKRRSLLQLSSTTSSDTTTPSIATKERLQILANRANSALDEHASDILKTFNARVAVISDDSTSTSSDFQQEYLRLGLISTESYNKKDQLVASLPYYDTDGSGLVLSSSLATNVVYKNVLPDGYDGWTGDVGLLAMILLNEMARANINEPKGINLPKRKDGIQTLLSTWISTLPTYDEMKTLHPLLWNEDEQEILQSSSTKKIYRLLDDIDDDSAWLVEKLWNSDSEDAFPKSVKIDAGEGIVDERPCFTPDGFRYAVALVRSRSYFVDGQLRLLPYLDYANHDDYDSYEIFGGGVGTLWGSAKGALLKSGKPLKVGDEVRISYGPKGPADYLLDHGFVPNMCQLNSKDGGGTAITAELSFEVNNSDRFRDDKLDILEYETYDLAPMEPTQTFDVMGGPGSTGEPDPAMIQFLRLVNLGGKDAFLLESIFRKEIWQFMSDPVSEENERGAVTAVIEACQNALSEMDEEESALKANDDGEEQSEQDQLCRMVRESEREALDRTLVTVKQDAEALDLKEYYQERRLKDLGLDSEWTPEDDGIAFGGTRVPGGADYDW